MKSGDRIHQRIIDALVLFAIWGCCYIGAAATALIVSVAGTCLSLPIDDGQCAIEAFRVDETWSVEMRQFLAGVLMVGAMITVGGCGGERLVMARGQVVKNGEPLIPEEGQALMVGFIPISEDGKPATNWYAAEVDQETATFTTAGALKKGMPPGKYRVAVELQKLPGKKDLFKEKFNGADSPFVVEVDDASIPIVLDVENPQDTTK